MEVLTKRAKKMCKQGKVLFKVYAFPDNCDGFIEVRRPLSKPYIIRSKFSTITSWFCKAIVESSIGDYETYFSLTDAGILPNTYNSHRTFTKRKHAEKYLADVKSGLYTKPVKEDKWFSMGDRDPSGLEGIDYDAEVHGELAVLGEDYEVAMYEPV